MRLEKTSRVLILLTLPALLATCVRAQEHPNIQPNAIRDQLAGTGTQTSQGAPQPPPQSPAPPAKAPGSKAPAKAPAKGQPATAAKTPPAPASKAPANAQAKAPEKAQPAAAKTPATAPAAKGQTTKTPAPSAPQAKAPSKEEAKAPAKTPAKTPEISKAPAKAPSPGKTPNKTAGAKPAKPPVEKPAVEKAVVRRDPFDTLLTKARADSGPPQNLPPGKAGLIVATLRIDGIVRGPNGMIVIVSNPQQRVYFLREGDKLYDGSVDKIALDAVSFHEFGKDAFGKPLERLVTKRLYPSPGEQP